VTYTITYTGADTVTLADGDVTVNTTGTAGATATVTGSGTATRTVTLSGFSGRGTLGISLAAGTASDTAGNLAGSAGPGATFIVNAAPAAGGDSLQRPPGEGVKVKVSTLLGNDTDADGDTVTFNTFDTASANGGTILQAGPWLIYSPPVSDATDTFHYTVSDGRGGTATGTVTITTGTSDAQSKNILSVATVGSDKVITFIGIPALTYTVQYTTDLGTPVWHTLSTVTAGADGKFSYTDVNPVDPARFYRTTYP
jgi:hypothetical protein